MSITLDPQTEQRIQRELERGHYREPDEVINHALDLLESEDEWFLRNKDAIAQRLERSVEQAKRGNLYTGDEARRMLAQRRAQRAE